MAVPEEIDLEADIRQTLANLAGSLPESVDVVAIGVRSKAPYKALAVREALIWRTEELGRGAYEMFQRGDLASAILLTRGVVECTALMARLAQIVFERTTMTENELQETLSRMLLGWKSHLPHLQLRARRRAVRLWLLAWRLHRPCLCRLRAEPGNHSAQACRPDRGRGRALQAAQGG
jgi:hypothetical protein